MKRPVAPINEYVGGEYCFFLNSEDLHQEELPLVSNHASGGTMLLWSRLLDPYVTVQPPTTSSFTVAILAIPNYQTSIHIAIYLPTHGKDAEFISELAELKICVHNLAEKHPGAALFVRGDGNVNIKNKKRVSLLEHFLNELSLKQVVVGHPTYHHFTGGGAFDSSLDIILNSTSIFKTEEISEIICKNANPAVLSHHDPIISKFYLPYQPCMPNKDQNLVTPPKLDITRRKIKWNEEGIVWYEHLVSPRLSQIREHWLKPASLSSMSILLKVTNMVLSNFASMTNDSKVLRAVSSTKSKKTPAAIIKAKRKLYRTHKRLKMSDGLHQQADIKSMHRQAKREYKNSVRRSRIKDYFERDQKLFQILEENPRGAFAFINSFRKSSASKIETLSVGDKVYQGDRVPDGFYDSMSSIKTCNLEQLSQDPYIAEHLSNHDHILKLCQDKRTIPPINLQTSTALLNRLKKNVSDIYSITALHFLNAGNEGLKHFNCILNGIISNVNLATIEEMNMVLGLIFYKGHNKPKTSDRSYRTISTCPLWAKAVDLYLRDLYHHHWDQCQAPTQYQGRGSSHELAALLVTEVIQYSMNVAKKPVFLLALDAQSAFDRCLRQILSTQLFRAGVQGSALKFIDNRLTSRATVYQWDGVMMGPSADDTGFEQGGINSSEYYKLYNNEQLITTQLSNLGVNINSCVVSSIGQADDVIHVANTGGQDRIVEKCLFYIDFS